MVNNKTIKDDSKLTVISVDGKYGPYDVYIQLGRVMVLPNGKKTTIYQNGVNEKIKGIDIGDH